MSHVFRLASTHVKTRRLYYLYRLAQMIDEYGSLRKERLEEKIITESTANKHFFKQYKDSTGEITKSNAFNRYLSLGIDMGLFSIVQKEITNTIEGMILSKLKNENELPYYLGCQLKCFFLKTILVKDFDYMYIIFKLINENRVSGNNFVNEFISYIINDNITSEKQNIMSTMKLWKDPDKYFMENIYAPRRSWLIDLNIISPKQTHRVLFKSELEKILKNFFDYKIGTTSYINDKYYGHMALNVLNKQNVIMFSSYSENIQKQIVKKQLDNIFENLKGTTRLSSRLFFELTSINSFCDDNLVIEIAEVEQTLNKISSQINSNYRYRSVPEISVSGNIINAGYITKS